MKVVVRGNGGDINTGRKKQFSRRFIESYAKKGQPAGWQGLKTSGPTGHGGGS